MESPAFSDLPDFTHFPGIDLHQLSPGIDLDQLSPGIDLHQLSPGIDLHQLSPGIDFSENSLDIEDYIEDYVDVLGFTSDPPQPVLPSHPPRPVLPRSEAIGVTLHQKNKLWEAHLWVKNRQLGMRKKKGTQIFLGNFQTKDEAKCAHDHAAIKLNVRVSANGKPYPLNFPESDHTNFMALHADWSARDFLWRIRRFSHTFTRGLSGMKGVSVRRGKRGGIWYEAKIRETPAGESKQTFELGKFESEEAAGRAYDRALLFFKGLMSDCVTNFRPSEYRESEVQAAGIQLQINARMR